MKPKMTKEDMAALSVLETRTVSTFVPSFFIHYLYFENRKFAKQAARLIREFGYDVEVRLGADGKNWLTYAKKKSVISDDLIAETRMEFERIAEKLNGEYDGWEVEAPFK